MRISLLGRILVLAFHYECHPISFSCSVVDKNTTSNTTAISFPSLQQTDHVFDSYFHITRHRRVTVPEEISFTGTVLNKY